MAAQLRDEGRSPSVKLVRPKDFARVEANCKNPPKPSAALVSLFATRKSKIWDLGACTIPGFKIEPLGEHHLREAFSCDNEVIDHFIRGRCLKDHDRYKVRVRVATIGEDPTVIGFYSLALNTLAPRALSFFGNKFGNRQIPSVYLSMIATRVENHKQGIGTDLMFHAFDQTLQIADMAGTACLTLDAVDEEKAVWYEGLSFERIETGSLSMYIPIGTIKEACEAAG